MLSVTKHVVVRLWCLVTPNRPGTERYEKYELGWPIPRVLLPHYFDQLTRDHVLACPLHKFCIQEAPLRWHFDWRTWCETGTTRRERVAGATHNQCSSSGRSKDITRSTHKFWDSNNFLPATIANQSWEKTVSCSHCTRHCRRNVCGCNRMCCKKMFFSFLIFFTVSRNTASTMEWSHYSVIVLTCSQSWTIRVSIRADKPLSISSSQRAELRHPLCLLKWETKSPISLQKVCFTGWHTVLSLQASTFWLHHTCDHWLVLFSTHCRISVIVPKSIKRKFVACSLSLLFLTQQKQQLTYVLVDCLRLWTQMSTYKLAVCGSTEPV